MGSIRERAARRRISRCAVFGLALKLTAFGCGSAPVLLQSPVTPGSNRPPVFALADISATNSGQLQINATIFDPDGDATTLRYEQSAGPFATESSAFVVGGAASYLLQPNGDGLYAFRLIASDGFFESVADVHVTLGSAPSDESAGRVVPAPALEGFYDIRLSGQVNDGAGGLSAFALEGTLEIESGAPGSPSGSLQLTLETDAGQNYLGSPTGAVILNQRVAAAIATPKADAKVTLLLDGAAWQSAGASSAAAFRGVGRAGVGVPIGAALMDLRASAGGITGTVFLSSYSLTTSELRLRSEYVANLTGTRLR